jgi:hypothetical protein
MKKLCDINWTTKTIVIININIEIGGYKLDNPNIVKNPKLNNVPPNKVFIPLFLDVETPEVFINKTNKNAIKKEMGIMKIQESGCQIILLMGSFIR